MAGVVVEAHDPLGRDPQVLGDRVEPLVLGETELATRRAHEPVPGSPLAQRLPEGPAARRPRHAVVLLRVRLVVEYPVLPLACRRAGAGEGHQVDLAGRDPELLEEAIDRAPGIARVVLEPAPTLFGGAADDAPIRQDGRGRAVRLGDPEDDHGLDSIRGGRLARGRDVDPPLAGRRRSSGGDDFHPAPCSTSPAPATQDQGPVRPSGRVSRVHQFLDSTTTGLMAATPPSPLAVTRRAVARSIAIWIGARASGLISTVILPGSYWYWPSFSALPRAGQPREQRRSHPGRAIHRCPGAPPVINECAQCYQPKLYDLSVAALGALLPHRFERAPCPSPGSSSTWRPGSPRSGSSSVPSTYVADRRPARWRSASALNRARLHQWHGHQRFVRHPLGHGRRLRGRALPGDARAPLPRARRDWRRPGSVSKGNGS